VPAIDGPPTSRANQQDDYDDGAAAEFHSERDTGSLPLSSLEAKLAVSTEPIDLDPTNVAEKPPRATERFTQKDLDEIERKLSGKLSSSASPPDVSTDDKQHSHTAKDSATATAEVDTKLVNSKTAAGDGDTADTPAKATSNKADPQNDETHRRNSQATDKTNEVSCANADDDDCDPRHCLCKARPAGHRRTYGHKSTDHQSAAAILKQLKLASQRVETFKQSKAALSIKKTEPSSEPSSKKQKRESESSAAILAKLKRASKRFANRKLKF